MFERRALLSVRVRNILRFQPFAEKEYLAASLWREPRQSLDLSLFHDQNKV